MFRSAFSDLAARICPLSFAEARVAGCAGTPEYWYGVTASSAPVGLPDLQLSAGGPFGIYVHVPFCFTRCGYCDFNTYTPAELGGVNPDAWLEKLRSELELAAARLPGPTVQTVFIGGGTPSLLGGAPVGTPAR